MNVAQVYSHKPGTYICADCEHPHDLHSKDGCSFDNCPCDRLCVKITPAELHVMRLVASGKTAKEAAAASYGKERSPNTIAVHKCSLYSKLGVTSTQELTVLALRLGVITLSDIPVPDIAISVIDGII